MPDGVKTSTLELLSTSKLDLHILVWVGVGMIGVGIVGAGIVGVGIIGAGMLDGTGVTQITDFGIRFTTTIGILLTTGVVSDITYHLLQGILSTPTATETQDTETQV